MITHLTAGEVKRKIDRGDDALVVNVLGRTDFEEKHIPGSINIPLDELDRRAPQELKDRDQEIIVYCASRECTASPEAAKKLERMGYRKIEDFDDGMKGWEEAGFKTEGKAAH